MPCQLPTDCLNEVFKYLEEDKATLRSCLLVSRLWCEIAVRILWSNIWDFDYTCPILSQIPVTLIACLPDESKDLLHRNGIPTPTSNPPLFDYAAFCKVLSIYKIDIMIRIFLTNQKPHALSNNNLNLVTQEMLKMFMKQVSSLKQLIYYVNIPNITLTNFPGARDRLADLSELSCNSDVNPEFFCQLSQICHNIQSLDIRFRSVSNGLLDLISAQNGLKYLSILNYHDSTDGKEIIRSLTKHSNSLIKLDISGQGSLSFISNFPNIQELIISFSYINYGLYENDFNGLQYAIFPRLQILKFSYECPDARILIKFLEVNGKNLKELHIRRCDSLNLAIAKFCPNLKLLFTRFMIDEIETLKVIFNSCQQLESFGGSCNKEKEMFEIIAEYSPKNFHELKLSQSILSKDLESFIVSWKNRIPQKSLSIIVLKDIGSSSDCHDFPGSNEVMKVIEKYKKVGIIKKFEVE